MLAITKIEVFLDRVEKPSFWNPCTQCAFIYWYILYNVHCTIIVQWINFSTIYC